MSSELRELVIRALQSAYAHGEKHAPFALHDCARQIVHAALLARTEAGPSLLCQSDACAHKGTAHNFCTPRTEAWADGRIDHHKAMQALEDLDDCARMDVGIAATGPYDLLRRYIMQQNRSHPQDASGDAERFAAVMNCQWLRSSKYGDQVFGWREEFLSRVNAEVAAMQAKEAK